MALAVMGEVGDAVEIQGEVATTGAVVVAVTVASGAVAVAVKL